MVGFKIAVGIAMTVKKATIIIGLICVALNDWALASRLAPAQPKEDKRIKQLESERRKLSGTKNPVNRAKSLMRIAEITLSFLNDAAKLNDASSIHAYVAQYRQAVTDARDAMMTSGLDPHKKSGGYKAVEIALRKQIRALQDIARTLSVDERQPVDETIDLVMKFRDEFIHALFGPIRTGSTFEQSPATSIEVNFRGLLENARYRLPVELQSGWCAPNRPWCPLPIGSPGRIEQAAREILRDLDPGQHQQRSSEGYRKS